MNIESHASHPSLPAFLEDIKLEFQRVHVNNHETYNLIIVEGKPAEISSSTPNHLTVNKINIQKNIGLRGCDSVVPESVLEEREVFPFLPVLTLEDDVATFLSHSGGEEKEFLQGLLQTFSTVPSTHPGDICRVTDPNFLMDIVLKDPNHPLPIDIPYPTTAN